MTMYLIAAAVLVVSSLIGVLVGRWLAAVEERSEQMLHERWLADEDPRRAWRCN